MSDIKFIKKTDKIISAEQAAYEAYHPNGDVPWSDIHSNHRASWTAVVQSVINHNLARQKHEFRLHPFLAKDQSMVLSGVSLGADARVKFKLEDIPPYEDVAIIVPDTVISFNRSFFRGLFEPTILKYGVDSFKNQFTFYSINNAIGRDIYSGLRPYES